MDKNHSNLGFEYPIIIVDKMGIRRLQFGEELIQGVMKINEPNRLLLDYAHKMMSWLLFKREPKSILQIGLGAGSISRFILEHFPCITLDVVEIDSRVVEACVEQFALPKNDHRLFIHIGDGDLYIENAICANKKWDVVIFDAYGVTSDLGKFGLPKFYGNCSKILAQGGLLVLNLIATDLEVLSYSERLEKVFGNRLRYLTPTPETNVIVIAANDHTLNDNPSLMDEIRKECRSNLDLRTEDWIFSK